MPGLGRNEQNSFPAGECGIRPYDGKYNFPMQEAMPTSSRQYSGEIRAISFCLCKKKWQKKNTPKGDTPMCPPLESPRLELTTFLAVPAGEFTARCRQNFLLSSSRSDARGWVRQCCGGCLRFSHYRRAAACCRRRGAPPRVRPFLRVADCHTIAGDGSQ